MKALRSTIKTGEAVVVKKKNGCHLQNKGHVDLIFHVHILGFMCTKYEVSMI